MGLKAEDALAASIAYTDGVVTGDVKITETSDGGLQFSANGGSSIVVLGPDKVRGRGIKSAAIDNSKHLIITYSDDEVEDLGLIKIKGDRISINENTEFKMNLKITKYDDDGNESEEITDNLKPAVIKVEEDGSNDDVNYRVNFTTYDENGNPSKTLISPNMIPPKHNITPNENNNDYSFKVNISTKDENGTKLEITPNLKGNIFWEGVDIIGESMVFEVKADDGINYSRKNDLYLNSETGNIYKRTDTGNVNNFWTKIGSLKGPIGNGAYQEAVEEGFTGTRAEWLLTLVGQTNLTEKRWVKPLISDEGTDMKIWYYYQIDGDKPDTAWKYEITPPDRTYPIGNYAFNLNTKYYTFTTTQEVILGEGGKYDIKYIADERNNKITAYFKDKETLEQIEHTLDIFIANAVPEGYEEVVVNVNPLGKWAQTMYLGSSKTNCEEITITTGMSFDGIITSDVFYNVIGESSLKIGVNIKDAINKMFDMIKSDPDAVLNTNSNSLFEAVNELVTKKHIDCYELIDSDLLTHCLSSDYKILSSNFIYCENCTNVPNHNNGYGYAMLIISQDTHYRQVIFFDPSNGQISSNNIGDNGDKTDFGNWSGWHSVSDDLTKHVTDTDIHTNATEKASYLKKTDKTTTINRSSTDEQIPTAKTVYNRTMGNAIMQTVIDTYGNQILKYPAGKWHLNAENAEKLTDLPNKYVRYVEVLCESDVITPWTSAFITKSYRATSNKGENFIRVITNGIKPGVMNIDTGWQKICTTSFMDVPLTNIAPNNESLFANFKGNSKCNYCVKNGICYITLWGVIITSTGLADTDVVLPTPLSGASGTLMVSNGDATPRAYAYILEDTRSTLRFVSREANMNLYGSFSYPVAEE